MDSVEFLDAVRARHNLPSDNKLAQFLGMPQGRVAEYRTGRRKLDQDACLKVAKALELPAEHVFASVQAERAKRTEHRKVWERLARIAKHAGAAVVVGLIASTAPPTITHAKELSASSVYSVKRRTWWPSWRPRIARALFPATFFDRRRHRRRTGRVSRIPTRCA